MRNVLTMTSICASLLVMGLTVAHAGEVQVAAGSDCHKRCQAQENQCRMASKDLDSSTCAAKFLACIQSCRGR